MLSRTDTHLLGGAWVVLTGVIFFLCIIEQGKVGAECRTATDDASPVVTVKLKVELSSEVCRQENSAPP